MGQSDAWSRPERLSSRRPFFPQLLSLTSQTAVWTRRANGSGHQACWRFMTASRFARSQKLPNHALPHFIPTSNSLSTISLG